MLPIHFPAPHPDIQNSHLQFDQNENPDVASSLFHQKALIPEIPSTNLLSSRTSAISAKAASINPLQRVRQTLEQDTAKTRKIGEESPLSQGKILQNNRHLLQKPKEFCDPLLTAINHRDISMVKALVKQGADLNQPNEEEYTPLLIALENRDIPMVKALIGLGAKPNQLDAEGETPLLTATDTQDISLVKVLIELGANPNQSNEKGETPLLTAIDDQNIPMVIALIELGANPNKMNRITRESPLFAAAANGHREMIRTLVKCGADPMLADNITGDTPLHGAVLAGNIGIIELFVKEFHVDPNGFNKMTGETPLLLALNDKNFSMARCLVKEFGANPNCANQNTYVTPLLRAINDNDIEMVRFLVSELGADPNLVSKEGRTPWIEATVSNYHDLAKELESLGAKVQYGREYLDRIFLAHVWSIEGESVLDGHKFNLGGLTPEYSLGKISDHLELFFNNTPTPLFLGALKTIKEIMSSAYPFATLSSDEIIDRIQAKKSHVMIINAEEHAIGIIFHQGNIVVCNRGYGSTAYAIEFFSYDTSKLTKKVIDQLKSHFDTVDSLFRLLNSLNITYLNGVPQNDQYADNCTWITSKSVLYVIFHIVLENHELSCDVYKKLSESIKTISYNSYLSSSLKPDHKLIQAIRSKQIAKEEIDYAAYLLLNLVSEEEFFEEHGKDTKST
jgi:ankyrin repeat protein